MQRIDAAAQPPQIFQTSSVRNTGFRELAEFVAQAQPLGALQDADRENYFLKKEVRYHFGEVGLKQVNAQLPGAEYPGFEARRLHLLDRLFSEAGPK